MTAATPMATATATTMDSAWVSAGFDTASARTDELGVGRIATAMGPGDRLGVLDGSGIDDRVGSAVELGKGGGLGGGIARGSGVTAWASGGVFAGTGWIET